VSRRHPSVRNADCELGADALGAALRAATECHGGEVGQAIPNGTSSRAPAFEHQHQHWLGPGSYATGLAIFVEAKGRALRVTHNTDILTSLVTQIVRGFL
jgi:hypothetical protein